MALTGKVAVVTGVSSGLGVGIAKVFAARGARVVGTARRADLGAALAKEIEAEGGSFTFVAGDISRPADAKRMVVTCLDKHGRVDCLINNAGVTQSLAPVEEIPEETFRSLIDINLMGTFYMCREVLPGMKRQRDGVIINIGSVNGVFGVAGQGAYTASKAGLIHLTKTIATEGFAHNVRANSIILGGVQSDMNDTTSFAMAESVVGVGNVPQSFRTLKSQGAMTPEAVGRALALLCDPDAAVITGAEIAIDQANTAGRLATAAMNLGFKALIERAREMDAF